MRAAFDMREENGWFSIWTCLMVSHEISVAVNLANPPPKEEKYSSARPTVVPDCSGFVISLGFLQDSHFLDSSAIPANYGHPANPYTNKRRKRLRGDFPAIYHKDPHKVVLQARALQYSSHYTAPDLWNSSEWFNQMKPCAKWPFQLGFKHSHILSHQSRLLSRAAIMEENESQALSFSTDLMLLASNRGLQRSDSWKSSSNSANPMIKVAAALSCNSATNHNTG